MAGSVVHTLVLTDIATGWTECIPLIVRDQALIFEALEQIQKALPFPLRGFDTDNDGAFINRTVLNYCRRTGLEFTRSRAYRKNDQAWVEQKNGAVVRKLVGYDRLSGIVDVEKLARLYEFSRFYVNCFQPSFKLKSKVRMSARVVKTYHQPLTPYERVVSSPHVPQAGKQQLQAIFPELEPIARLQNIRGVQQELAVAGVSATRLKTLLRNSTGMPVHHYVIGRRVESPLPTSVSKRRAFARRFLCAEAETGRAVLSPRPFLACAASSSARIGFDLDESDHSCTIREPASLSSDR